MSASSSPFGPRFHRSLLWTCWLPLLGLVIFIGATVIFGQGSPGSEAQVGWPNRLLMITYCVWLITFAVQALQLRSLAERERLQARTSASGPQRSQAFEPSPVGYVTASAAPVAALCFALILEEV
jgi:predicted secreted protein